MYWIENFPRGMVVDPHQHIQKEELVVGDEESREWGLFLRVIKWD